MEIKKLNWEKFVGHFSTDLIAEIQGFNVNYFIYIDRNTGKTMGIGLDMNKQEFKSIEEAKFYFQNDFENKLKQLLQH